MYDFLIVTHLPAFYKTNLYNAIAEHKRIFVIFIAAHSVERTDDFISLDCKFPYAILNQGAFESRNQFRSLFRIIQILPRLHFKTVLVSGWDLIEFWFLALFCRRSQRALALESTIYESRSDGIRGWFKRVFLTQMQTVFASGSLHAQLAQKLGFRREIVITRGVGIINPKATQGSHNRLYQKRFLFLGRLSEEKNLKWLLSVFRSLPSHKLVIAGQGPQFSELRQLASPNISFSGHIPNNRIDEVFSQCDFLILASLRETWGLVIEEALARGIPVFVSDRCGAAELVSVGVNGYTFSINDAEGLAQLIRSINQDSYQALLDCFSQVSFSDNNHKQSIAYDVHSPR